MTRIVFYDSETYLSRPGRQAPRIVCGAFADTLAPPFLCERERALDQIEAELALGETLCGHFIAYDMACAIAARPSLLRPIFRAYREDRIRCTEVREKLIRIAQGTAFKYKAHGLLECARRHSIETTLTDADKSGPDAWRLRYAELDGVSIADYPPEARAYPLGDIRTTAALHASQERYRDRGWLEDEHRQARASFVLFLCRAWGMRTDPRTVAELARKLEEDHDKHAATLRAAGILRPDGTKDTKRAKARMLEICAARGLDPELTDTGAELVKDGGTPEQAIAAGYVALHKDACDAVGDEVLSAYYAFASADKTRGRLRRLERAGSLPVQPRYDSLKETGRTSAAAGEVDPGELVSAWGDAVQNLDRAPGLRECYQARPGHLLCSWDWSAAELHSLAQVCIEMRIGSELAKVLNAGRDPHLELACLIRGWAYEWAKAALKGTHGDAAKRAAKDARQGAKAANFGFPGGLGAKKFRVYAARQYKVFLSEAQSYELRDGWLTRYPEMTAYFAEADRIAKSGDPLVHGRSGRRRGGLYFTEAANTPFQGRTADMAKCAGFELAWGCYVEGPLLGSRIWYFGHDEWILEHPEHEAHERSEAQGAVQLAAGARWCPDVPVRGEPALMRRWRKEAGPVYRDGRLIPYEDRELGDDVIAAIRKDYAQSKNALRVSWTHGIEAERLIAIAS
jgi:DNA polymerase-1